MNLTRENYHNKQANMEYVSASQIKSFLACPACALAELKGEWERTESTSLLQGSYLDAMFEGKERRLLFELRHPEMMSSKGASKGQLKADFVKCVEAYNRVMADTVMAHYRTKGQQQVIMTGEVMGVPVKIMIDVLHPDIIVDGKYMCDFEDKYVDGERKNWALAWGYDIQGALYQEVVEQNTGKKLPFALSGVTKEPVPNIEMFLMSDETLENALGLIKANIQRINAIKKGEIEAPRCGECAYCKQTKIVSSNQEDWFIL